MEVDEEPPRLHKLSISGATLAALLHSATVSSSADSLGLLFGHTSLVSPPSLSDYPTSTDAAAAAPSSSTDTSTLTATVTSFLSSSLPHLLPPSATPSTLLGVFSARRRSNPIPSLRDSSLLLSPPFDKPALPRLLLLLTTPPPSSSAAATALIHTHEYRAFQYIPSVGRFEAISVEIVNVGGLGFRGSYGSFRSIGEEDGGLGAKGFERLIGDDAETYKKGVEGAYERMLMTVERLGREVERSNAAVYEMVEMFSPCHFCNFLLLLCLV